MKFDGIGRDCARDRKSRIGKRGVGEDYRDHRPNNPGTEDGPERPPEGDGQAE